MLCHHKRTELAEVLYLHFILLQRIIMLLAFLQEVLHPLYYFFFPIEFKNAKLYIFASLEGKTKQEIVSCIFHVLMEKSYPSMELP